MAAVGQGGEAGVQLRDPQLVNSHFRGCSTAALLRRRLPDVEAYRDRNLVHELRSN